MTAWWKLLFIQVMQKIDLLTSHTLSSIWHILPRYWLLALGGLHQHWYSCPYKTPQGPKIDGIACLSKPTPALTHFNTHSLYKIPNIYVSLPIFRNQFSRLRKVCNISSLLQPEHAWCNLCVRSTKLTQISDNAANCNGWLYCFLKDHLRKIEKTRIPQNVVLGFLITWIKYNNHVLSSAYINCCGIKYGCDMILHALYVDNGCQELLTESSRMQTNLASIVQSNVSFWTC